MEQAYKPVDGGTGTISRDKEKLIALNHFKCFVSFVFLSVLGVPFMHHRDVVNKINVAIARYWVKSCVVYST